jgi:putative transposase
MREVLEDLLGFTAFPPAHWNKIWSTNSLERVQQGGQTSHRRGSESPPALGRLTGAVLIDRHDEWQVSERRYLSEGSMNLLQPDQSPKEVAPTELMTT